MTADQSPSIRQCGFCELGLLRFRQCPACYTFCAVCDQCELVWDDIPAASMNPQAASAGSFPMCPSCGSANEVWLNATIEELRTDGLDRFIDGKSG